MDIVEVIEAGMFTTVQDLGRYGFQRYGVPISGALDPFSLRVANLLVGNQEGDAGLEISMAGAKLRCLADTLVAITGADLGAFVNDRPLPMWKAVPLAQGDVLAFIEVRQGIRAYLALAGGLDVPTVLGSRSTYTRASLGGLEGRVLAAGDRLPTTWNGAVARAQGRKLPSVHIPTYGHSHALRVVLGPQEEAFTHEGIQTFLTSTYTVTSLSDRTGYRLDGPPIQHKSGADIISDGIPLGAVQITGDGMPIVLLADRGITGGYTKIATVISADIPILAQANSGDTATFRAVSVEEGHTALKEQEEVLRDLGSSPPIEFASHQYRVRVDGGEHQAVTELRELEPEAGARLASPQRRTVRVTAGGETFSFDVELDSADGV